MSTLKTNTLDTPSGSGNITVNRPTILTAGDIVTADLADDAVTTVKLVNDAVTEAKIVNNAVTEAKIVNNAVTLAKMAGGTDGQIITYDASGDPVAVGPGTSGQVLTSAGTGAPPAFAAAAAMELSPRWWIGTGLNQTITSGTVTRVTGWAASAEISAGGGYASSRFTVPSGQAGDYVIGSNLSWHDSGFDLTQVYTKFYKNGAWVYGGYGVSFNTSGDGAVHWGDRAIMMITLAVGDYIDVYGQAVGTGTIRIFTNDGGNQKFANFWGFKIG